MPLVSPLPRGPVSAWRGSASRLWGTGLSFRHDAASIGAGAPIRRAKAPAIDTIARPSESAT